MHDQLNPIGYYREFIAQFHSRHDTRSSWTTTRPITISNDCYHSTDASSLVKIGKAMATCGIRIELIQPSIESPKKGQVVVTLDASSRCNNTIKPGTSGGGGDVSGVALEAAACTELLQSIVVDWMVDLEELSVVEGKLAFILYVDVYCLNDESSLMDLALLSVTGALGKLRLPKLKILGSEDVNGDELEQSQLHSFGDIVQNVKIVEMKSRPLQLRQLPISLSFGFFTSSTDEDDSNEMEVLADPSRWELERCKGYCSFILDSKTGKLLRFLKYSGRTLSADKYMKCLSISRERAAEALEHFNK